VPHCAFYTFARYHIRRVQLKKRELSSAEYSGSDAAPAAAAAAQRERELLAADEAACAYDREQLVAFLRENDPTQSYTQAMSNAASNIQRTKGQLKQRVLQLLSQPLIREQLRNVRAEIERYLSEEVPQVDEVHAARDKAAAAAAQSASAADAAAEKADVGETKDEL
jgi:hypothetical protein